MANPIRGHHGRIYVDNVEMSNAAVTLEHTIIENDFSKPWNIEPSNVQVKIETPVFELSFRVKYYEYTNEGDIRFRGIFDNNFQPNIVKDPTINVAEREMQKWVLATQRT